MRCAVLGLALLSAVALASAGSPLGLSSPLLVWSNRGGVVGPGQGKEVSYQVLQNAEQVAAELVLGALGRATEDGSSLTGLIKAAVHAEEQRALVVFIGSQLDVTDLRSRATAVGALDAMLGAAVSSLVVPYATSKGNSMRESVCSKLDELDVQHEVIGCSAPSTNLKVDVAAALAKGTDAKFNVVVVCSHTEPAQEDTNAGLTLEVEQLQEVQAAVDEAGLGHVFVYASQVKPQAVEQAAEGGKRRSLLATTYTGFGPYTSCGVLCQTQVRWLEGMLAVLVLALASCAGLVCLNVLDTPTRFESPKEGAPQ